MPAEAPTMSSSSRLTAVSSPADGEAALIFFIQKPTVNTQTQAFSPRVHVTVKGRPRQVVMLSPSSLIFALLVLAAGVRGSSDDDAQARAAREAHEAAAQKALTDSLTDALAMMRHGSVRCLLLNQTHSNVPLVTCSDRSCANPSPLSFYAVSQARAKEQAAALMARQLHKRNCKCRFCR